MPSWTPPVAQTPGYYLQASDWNAVENNLAYLYGDAGWTAVTAFTNSWAATSGATPSYILLGRTVFLRGSVQSGTALTAAFTLPAGYRPSATGFYVVITTGTTINRIEIDATGAVTPDNSAVTRLDGISFPAV